MTCILKLLWIVTVHNYAQVCITTANFSLNQVFFFVKPIGIVCYGLLLLGSQRQHFMQTIEQLVDFKKFGKESQKAFISVMHLANRLADLQDELFKPVGITRQQYNVLRILRGVLPKSANQAYLKARLIDRNSDMSRMIVRLLKAGFVERTVNLQDRRSVDVRITEKGLEKLRSIDKSVLELETSFGNLSPGELEQLTLLLGKVLETYKDGIK